MQQFLHSDDKKSLLHCCQHCPCPEWQPPFQPILFHAFLKSVWYWWQPLCPLQTVCPLSHPVPLVFRLQRPDTAFLSAYCRYPAPMPSFVHWCWHPVLGCPYPVQSTVQWRKYTAVSVGIIPVSIAYAGQPVNRPLHRHTEYLQRHTSRTSMLPVPWLHPDWHPDETGFRP